MEELYNPFPKLPKNIRQIGDQDQVVRYYMEDYVNTYLKQLFPTGQQMVRVGLLLGNVEYHDGTPYIFVDGAMEMEGVETDGEKVMITDGVWKKAFQKIEETFPKRTIQGWFLCGGPGSQLSPLNYWKLHGQYFAGKNQLMYLNHGLEGDEAIYITSEDGFYRLKGHCIYYERNQMMQDYMILRKDVRRVESGSHEAVIKDFRSRMTAKKEQVTARSRLTGAMGMLCGALSVLVLAGGVVLVNNYAKMQRMESVLVSVLPENVTSWDEYRDQEQALVIEEIAGQVFPTKAEVGETAESFVAETMQADEQAGAFEVSANGSAQEQNMPTQGLVGIGKGEMAGGQSAGGAQSTAGGQSAGGTQQSTAGSQSAGGTQSTAGGQTSGESQSTAGAQNAAGDQSTAGVPNSENAQSSNTSQPTSASSSAPNTPDTQTTPTSTSPTSVQPLDYAAAQANGYRIYEVGGGETLYGICWAAYGSLEPLAEVCRLNNLQDEDRILAGQKLILP